MKTVYAAENRLNYVVDFLKDKSNDDSRLYKKSRERYEHMLEQCKEAVCLLSTILEEDALSADEIECESIVTNNEVMEVVAEMRQKLEQFENFTESVPKVPDKCEDKKEEPLDEDKDWKRTTMIEYNNALKHVVENAENVYEKDCARLIYDWFQIRFDRQLCPAFRYDMKNLPKWISNIVVMYGASVSNETHEDFQSNFYSWLNKLKSKDSQHNYVVPYEVYQIDRYMARDYTSLEAPILWDMLLDDGLDTLEHSKIPIDPSSVYNKVMSVLSDDEHSVLDRYNYYKEMPQVLKYSKLYSEV